MELGSIPYGLVLYALLAWVLYCVSLACYNLYFHPLAHFPGPHLRCAFAFPSVLEIWLGSSVRTTHALHVKYGSVVRVAPDALSYSSAQAWKDIYAFRQEKKQLPKDYKRVPPIKDALPILCTASVSNDVDHARMRKLMSHAFSDVALRQQMPLIASHMKRFIEQLRTQACRSEDGRVDLNEWFNYLAFDVVTDLSFGESLGALERGGPHPYIEGFFKSCRIFGVIPLMHEYGLFKKLFMALMSIPAVKRSHEMGYLATEAKVERRMHGSTGRNDFMTYILRHNDEKGMSRAEIIGSTTVLVNAGGEATAACMGAAIYYMLKDARVYRRALDEVRSCYSSETDIMAAPRGRLPYLEAVVDEVFRIYAPTPGNFARRTDAPTHIDGRMVPPHTSVGVHQYSAGHARDNFFEPEVFMPERWMDNAPPECAGDVKAAVQPWTLGPRVCLGRNVAMLEIRIALALVLWRFDMDLCSASDDWVGRQTYNIVWNRGPLWVRLRPRRSDVPDNRWRSDSE